MSQDNATLTCVAIKAPDNAEVVGQFGIGTTVDAQSLQILLDRWEHVRRFMEHQGPLFLAGDAPSLASTKSFIGALFWGQPLLGPGSGAYRQPWNWRMLFAQVLLLAVLPLSMLFGLVCWITCQLKDEPEWPPEVLSSVGGRPLDAQQLEAWRNVIPSRPSADSPRMTTPIQEAPDATR